MISTLLTVVDKILFTIVMRGRGGSVVELRAPEREVQGSIPETRCIVSFGNPKVLVNTQEAVAPSQND